MARLERTQWFHAPPPPEGRPLELTCGRTLPGFTLAYQTWGRLNHARDNAILLCHALSGDAHAAGHHEEDGRTGWWDVLVGPGKAFDTEKYFVICSNVLGGCKGSSGPSSADPATGRRWATDFPLITVEDMVRAQARLIDHLGIERLRAVAGGSMGGMQALAWARLFPDRAAGILPLASALRHTAQSIAWNDIGRRSIMGDPAWKGGHYYDENGPPPWQGQAIARMIGHVTYLSEDVMEQKFGRRLREKPAPSFSFDIDFQVESYLAYQARAFNQRFDPNSYLYITRALDYFDFGTAEGGAVEAFRRTQAKYLVLSFSSDWLYPPARSREMVEAIRAAGRDVEYHEIPTNLGHDAFLVLEEPQATYVRDFLTRLA